MKTILIYVFVAIGALTEFVHTKQIGELVIDTSKGGVPVANDKLYDFYVKDYFGLISGYGDRTGEVKSHLEQDYKRWTDHLKSNPKGLEVFKSAYTKAVDALTAYQHDVLMNYQQISPIGIADIVKAANHMRTSANSFYSKVKLNSPKCHDLVNLYIHYKWEKPAIYCAQKAITKTIGLQLQYTYDLNVYYVRLVDQFDMFAEVSDEHKEHYIDVNLKKASEELLERRNTQVKSIQNLLKDEQACSAASYGVFEKFEKSFTQQAAECL